MPYVCDAYMRGWGCVRLRTYINDWSCTRSFCKCKIVVALNMRIYQKAVLYTAFCTINALLCYLSDEISKSAGLTRALSLSTSK